MISRVREGHGTAYNLAKFTTENESFWNDMLVNCFYFTTSILCPMDCQYFGFKQHIELSFWKNNKILY